MSDYTKVYCKQCGGYIGVVGDPSGPPSNVTVDELVFGVHANLRSCVLVLCETVKQLQSQLGCGTDA